MYLLCYTGSLEILLQVGPLLVENLKQLEAWQIFLIPGLGTQALGSSLAAHQFALHPGPAPTSVLPHRLLDKYPG